MRSTAVIPLLFLASFGAAAAELPVHDRRGDSPLSLIGSIDTAERSIGLSAAGGEFRCGGIYDDARPGEQPSGVILCGASPLDGRVEFPGGVSPGAKMVIRTGTGNTIEFTIGSPSKAR